MSERLSPKQPTAEALAIKLLYHTVAEDGGTIVGAAAKLIEQRDAATTEAEQARWQERIYHELCDIAAAAELNINIDGGGCDSGDPLDFTITEIRQVTNLLLEKLGRGSRP
ncbi:MAG: hypothetical protein ACXWJB_04005 [Limisphaerales bacterium]